MAAVVVPVVETIVKSVIARELGNMVARTVGGDTGRVLGGIISGAALGGVPGALAGGVSVASNDPVVGGAVQGLLTGGVPGAITGAAQAAATQALPEPVRPIAAGTVGQVVGRAVAPVAQAVGQPIDRPVTSIANRVLDVAERAVQPVAGVVEPVASAATQLGTAMATAPVIAGEAIARGVADYMRSGQSYVAGSQGEEPVFAQPAQATQAPGTEAVAEPMASPGSAGAGELRLRPPSAREALAAAPARPDSGPLQLRPPTIRELRGNAPPWVSTGYLLERAANPTFAPPDPAAGRLGVTPFTVTPGGEFIPLTTPTVPAPAPVPAAAQPAAQPSSAQAPGAEPVQQAAPSAQPPPSEEERNRQVAEWVDRLNRYLQIADTAAATYGAIQAMNQPVPQVPIPEPPPGMTLEEALARAAELYGPIYAERLRLALEARMQDLIRRGFFGQPVGTLALLQEQAQIGQERMGKEQELAQQMVRDADAARQAWERMKAEAELTNAMLRQQAQQQRAQNLQQLASGLLNLSSTIGQVLGAREATRPAQNQALTGGPQPQQQEYRLQPPKGGFGWSPRSLTDTALLRRPGEQSLAALTRPWWEMA